jgi:hypothetical protein
VLDLGPLQSSDFFPPSKSITSHMPNSIFFDGKKSNFPSFAGKPKPLEEFEDSSSTSQVDFSNDSESSDDKEAVQTFDLGRKMNG